MYAVTGASGQLGRLVIEALLRTVKPASIVALVRDPSKLKELAARGVVVRAFDYNDPATLAPALAGVDRLLLISSSEVGSRRAQHQAVLDAAKAKNVGYIAYTSMLRASTSPMNLAVEHRETEAAITASGIPYAILRNGWYTENYVMSVAPAIEHGAFIGSAGDGRISGASREDFADAAAAILVDGSVEPRVLELAGDDAFTLTQFAAAIGEISGRPVIYKDLPEADYRGALERAGVPAPLADTLAESDAKAAHGALFEDGQVLSTLIGRPTTPWRMTLASALKG